MTFPSIVGFESRAFAEPIEILPVQRSRYMKSSRSLLSEQIQRNLNSCDWSYEDETEYSDDDYDAEGDAVCDLDRAMQDCITPDEGLLQESLSADFCPSKPIPIPEITYYKNESQKQALLRLMQQRKLYQEQLLAAQHKSHVGSELPGQRQAVRRHFQ